MTKDHLVFAAAHFITIGPDFCERLHGHNWRVAVDVSGPLDENQYVFDFIALRDAIQELVNELDHHVLLPTTHPQILVNVSDQEVEVVYRPELARRETILGSAGEGVNRLGERENTSTASKSTVGDHPHSVSPDPAVSTPRRWLFPKDECYLLPVQQTTAELIARWLGTRLIERLGRAASNLDSLRVHVEENFGQWASCELRIRDG